LSDVFGIQPWQMSDLSAAEYLMIVDDLKKRQEARS